MDTTQQRMVEEEHQAAEQLTNGALDIAYLIAAFPQCFFLNHNQRRPLKIGLLGDLVPLLPLLPFTEAEIQAVLRSYTRSDGYLHACTEGAIRIDVNGDAAGAVSAKHATHAQKVLAERELWRLKKKATREQQQSKVAADKERTALQSKPVQPAAVATRSPEPPPAQRQSTPKQGDSFSALKKAAALRREVAARG